MAYWPALKPTGQSSAPGMQVHSLDGQNDFMLVFEPGDEVLSGVLEFARFYNVGSAQLSAIGALSNAVLGWYDPAMGAYKVNSIPVQSEMTSLTGNLTMFNGQPTVHIHVNVALDSGLVMGGHALELYVMPTVEMYVRIEPETLTKQVNPYTHIPVIV